MKIDRMILDRWVIERKRLQIVNMRTFRRNFCTRRVPRRRYGDEHAALCFASVASLFHIFAVRDSWRHVGCFYANVDNTVAHQFWYNE